MVDFDRIISSTPLNATAARQLSRGVHYESKNNLQHRWLAPPLMRDLRAHLNLPGFVDLTGQTFGRLKALGIWSRPDRVSKSRPALWVCRCACGSYCGVKSKMLRNGTSDRCAECRNTRNLRNRDPLWKELADGKTPKVGWKR